MGRCGGQRFLEEVTYEPSIKRRMARMANILIRPTRLLLENCLFPIPPSSVGCQRGWTHDTSMANLSLPSL